MGELTLSEVEGLTPPTLISSQIRCFNPLFSVGTFSVESSHLEFCPPQKGVAYPDLVSWVCPDPLW